MSLCTAIHRTFISTSTHPRPKEHCGREGRKSVRAKGWEGLFSGHGLAIAHMNSQELWLPEQILHNVKYIKCPAKGKIAAPEAPLLSEQLLAADGGLEKDNHFLEGCVCGHC